MLEKIYILQTDGVVGQIGTYDDETDIFCSIRSYSIHYMRKYCGWGLDKQTLLRFSPKTRIVIIDEERQNRYETNVSTFIEQGITNTYWSHKPQIFLNEKFFNITNL